MQQTQPMGESLWYRYPCFLPYIGAFFFHIPVPWYFITQQIHRISHKYSMAWENAANCILWGEPGKLVAIFFPKLWMFPWYPKYVSSHWQNVGVPTNILEQGNMQQNSFYGENLENPYLYCSQSLDVSLSSDSHPMGRFTTLEMHGFFHNFMIFWKKRIKTDPIRKNWDIHLPWTHVPRYHGTVV